MLMTFRAVALLASLLMAGGGAAEAIAGEPLLAADFSENSLPADWRVAGGEWRVADGALQGKATEYLSQVVFPVGAVQDVAVEVTASFEAARNDGRWLALMVRKDPAAKAPFLVFTSRFDRSKANGVELGHALDPKPNWRIYEARPTGLGAALGEPHVLRVEVRGPHLAGFIDDQEVIRCELPAEMIRAGEVGLVVSDVTARFDNLRVERLPAWTEADQAAWLETRRAARIEEALTAARALVVAHRGNSLHAPENTMAAFREAFDAGADMVEADLRLSADGAVVLVHDATVDRTTDGRGAVAEMTAEQLKALDAGSWKGAAYAGEPVPTFDELAALAAERGGIFLDLKAPGMGQAIAQVAERHGIVDRLIACCWTLEQATDMAQHLPGVPRVMLGAAPADGDGAWFADLLSKGYHGFSLNHRTLTPAFMGAAQRRAMPVYAWTINDPQQMRDALRKGVDGILTDDPATLADLLREHLAAVWGDGS